MDDKKGVFIGQNVLGQLLMKLREEYQNKKENIKELTYVEPPEIEKFLLQDHLSSQLEEKFDYS